MVENGKRIYVSNLPYSATEDDLRDLFGKLGALKDLRIITDRETGQSRGFGFVEFEDGSVVPKALRLDGEDFHGRALRVAPAKPRERQ